LKLTYFSDLSSDGEINEEATDDITEEAGEEINDDVSFELVDDVDYGGNAEVIESPVRESPVRESPVRESPVRESPVRPRRSGRERQATRRSLDYHKEMRKGR
jgi:hypothetical protein